MKKRILIVEDELYHLDVIQSKLQLAGYEVLAAQDGEEGLEMIRKESIDLILLDVLLPRLNGFEILEKMKSEGITTPVIIVSNSGQPVEIDRGMELGAKDYLVKAEFNPEDVLNKVKLTLNADSSGVIQSSSASLGAVNPTTRQGVRVFIIEDDKFLRELIVSKLSSEGFSVGEASDGESGMVALKENPAQILLLDIILPGMDGFQVLKQIKADKTLSAIPVLVLSNLGQQEDIDLARSLGARDFLVKARYTPTEIMNRVKEILNESYINM